MGKVTIIQGESERGVHSSVSQLCTMESLTANPYCQVDTDRQNIQGHRNLAILLRMAAPFSSPF